MKGQIMVMFEKLLLIAIILELGISAYLFREWTEKRRRFQARHHRPELREVRGRTSRDESVTVRRRAPFDWEKEDTSATTSA